MSVEEILNAAKEIIYSFAGLTLSPVQNDSLMEFIKRRSGEKNIPVDEYLTFLRSNRIETQILINHVTVNETYFFRERMQFEFLASCVFPSFVGKKMKIWSAACATGEEALSLLALAMECGVDAEIYATDIDEDAIKFFRNGVYRKYSFRPDGSCYHSLLIQHGSASENDFVFDKEFLNKINISHYNLVQEDVPANLCNFDLVLLRNVCIYFDKETRVSVIRKISACMNKNSRLLFSINEVGSFGDELNELGLFKNHWGTFYFYEKNPDAERMYSMSLERKKTSETEIKKIIVPPEKPVKQLERKSVETAPIVTKKITADYKKDFESICSLVNFRKHKEALELCNEYEKSHETKALGKFFKGYINYYADEKSDALGLFETAITLKPDMWPAYFYNGLLLRDVGKDAKSMECFVACEKLLQDEAVAKKYAFILDSFDPAYFLSICRSLTKRS